MIRFLDIQSRVQRIVGDVTRSTVVIESGDAVGGGIILTSDGYVVTCSHIIKDKIVTVYINGDITTPVIAERISVDKVKDITIVKIWNPPVILSPTELSRKLPRVDQRGVLVSHPYGCYWTTAVGWVNAVRRINNNMMFQSDVTGTGGSSGGGFYSLNGDLLGMFQYRIVREDGAYADADLNMFFPAASMIQPEYDVMKTIRISREMRKDRF